MKLLFLHGWTFDRAFWTPLAALLDTWPHAFDDRGYFGAPHAPETAGPFVAVAHSHGAMRLLAGRPTQCRGLVAINGFDRFSADAAFPGVPRRVLDRMIAAFAADPGQVVAGFRARCGADAPPAPLDPAPLLRDLTDLRDGDARAAARAGGLPILSIQASDDPILPSAMREAVFNGTTRVEQAAITGGHLLPLSDPHACARAISGFVERLA